MDCWKRLSALSMRIDHIDRENSSYIVSKKSFLLMSEKTKPKGLSG